MEYKFFESDPRTQLFASTLIELGYDVDIVALRRPGQEKYEAINGVHVHRVQARLLNEKHPLSYLYRLVRFFLVAALFLAKRHLQDPYKLIQIESVPDFLVFAALLPRLFGSAVILDVYDIVPEFYASKFGVSLESPVIRLLLIVERLSVWFCNHVIVANHLWHDRLTSRIPSRSKFTTICYSSDPAIFHPRKRRRQTHEFRLVYPGTLNWHNGLDVAIRAFARAADSMPGAKFFIYGEGPSKSSIIKLAAQLGISRLVEFHEILPAPDIASVMADCDLGIVPKKADSLFANEAASTKILDLLAMAVPVIAARTKVEQYYFDDSLIRFFEPGNEGDLASAMIQLFHDATLRQRLVENGLRFMTTNNWNQRRRDYINVIHLVLKGSAVYREVDQRHLQKDRV